MLKVRAKEQPSTALVHGMSHQVICGIHTVYKFHNEINLTFRWLDFEISFSQDEGMTFYINSMHYGTVTNAECTPRRVNILEQVVNIGIGVASGALNALGGLFGRRKRDTVDVSYGSFPTALIITKYFQFVFVFINE